MFRYPGLCFLTLLLLVKGFSNEKTMAPPVKIITITVNANGTIYMNRDTMATDMLATQLHERLWRSYLGNDKMYDSIKIEWSGEVLMGVRGAALDAIGLAQQNTLKDLCLQKYKRLFEAIGSRQQKKIRKQFPVLFQKLQW